MGDIEDIIAFLRTAGVIRGNAVYYDGLVHYSEAISIILGLSPEESLKELLCYLTKNGYVVIN